MIVASTLLVFACGLQAEPTLTKPHRLGEGEIAALFQEILRRRRTIYFDGRTCGWRDRWLTESMSDHTYEQMLFTRAYPDHALRFMKDLLEDPESTLPDLHFGLNYFPWIQARSSPEFESLLVRMTEHFDDGVAANALRTLASVYGAGRHRERIWRFCLKGCNEAFEAISHDAEPRTVGFLTILEIGERQDPRFDVKQISRQCLHALKRIRILEARDWRARIEAFLLQEEPDDNTYWAAEVAEGKAPDLLRRYYGNLLKKDRGRLAPLLEASPFPKGLQDPRSFTSRFVSSVRIKETGNDFDVDLWGLAECGGTLTEVEKARLTHFGFLGDAELRLIEHMKASFWGRR